MAKVDLLFISDAHLGSGADSRQRERELCDLLYRLEPTTRVLYLLGDMFDFWFSYRHVVPRGHTRLLGTLAALADRGTELHYFIGNHDMWLFDYLQTEVGATMHDDPELMVYDGRCFLIGHGDGLGHLDKKFDFVRRVFRNRFNQRLFAVLPPAWTFPIAQRWSDSNKDKHDHEDCYRYLGDEREGIVIYCKERLRTEQIDYCIFGHRHTPLVHSLSESCTYVNTGDWLRNRSYAIYSMEEHRLQLHNEI